MERIRHFTLLLALSLGASACDQGLTAPPRVQPEASGDVVSSPGLTVMSRNLYLGADLDVLLGGGDPSTVLAQALAQLQQTNFGIRAQALAAEIVAEQPHLVGLQEVTTYGLPEVLGLGTDIDYLEILMYFIGAMGGDYTVAAYQEDFELVLPLVLGGQYLGNITYVDAEAILARGDVVITESDGGHYDAFQTFNVAGIAFPHLRGWAQVLATGAGHTVRFASTHMETQRFGEVQEAQARQLVGTFAAETHPVILVGDMNSAADRLAEEDEKSGSYHIFRKAGYVDLWLRYGTGVDGQTCCHEAVLDNLEPALYSRLDLVLGRYGPAGFGGRSVLHIVGDEVDDIIQVAPGYTLWPSDHAGIVATLWPAHGIRMKAGG